MQSQTVFVSQYITHGILGLKDFICLHCAMIFESAEPSRLLAFAYGGCDDPCHFSIVTMAKDLAISSASAGGYNPCRLLVWLAEK